MTLRENIVSEAMEWEGTPYHHQARMKGVGVDCVGLPIGVARALGLVPPAFDVAPYGRVPDGATLLRLCHQHMQPVPLADVQAGDVLVQRLHPTLPPQHMGIVVPHRAGLALLHAFGTADGKGRVVLQRLAPHHLALAVEAFALPGVA